MNTRENVADETRVGNFNQTRLSHRKNENRAAVSSVFYSPFPENRLSFVSPGANPLPRGLLPPQESRPNFLGKVERVPFMGCSFGRGVTSADQPATLVRRDRHQGHR